MNPPGTLVWFARHEFRLAWRDWLSMVTAGGRTRVRTVAIVLVAFAAVMHLLAYGMVSRYADVAINPDKTALVFITGTALLSLLADAVAGDGIGDARLLHALRPRSPAVLPGAGAEDFRGADRDHRAVRHGDGGAARRSLHQRAGLRRRGALARGLRRRRRHGRDRGGARGRADHRAVPHHRPQAHAAGRPDRRSRDRRRLRHRPAACRDRFERYAVALRRARFRCRSSPSPRMPAASCGGRRAPCSATGPHSRPCSARAC